MSFFKSHRKAELNQSFPVPRPEFSPVWLCPFPGCMPCFFNLLETRTMTPSPFRHQPLPRRPGLKSWAELVRRREKEREGKRRREKEALLSLTFLSTTNSFSAAVRRLISTSYLWARKEDRRNLRPNSQVALSSLWLSKCSGYRVPTRSKGEQCRSWWWQCYVPEYLIYISLAGKHSGMSETNHCTH